MAMTAQWRRSLLVAANRDRVRRSAMGSSAPPSDFAMPRANERAPEDDLPIRRAEQPPGGCLERWSYDDMRGRASEAPPSSA
jgi:hypothetical protein